MAQIKTAGMDVVLKAALFGDDLTDLDTDDPDQQTIGDPVAKYFEALHLQKIGVPSFGADWSEPIGMIATRKNSKSTSLAKAEPVHEDGVFVEKVGAQTWRYHYANGKLTRQELEDPEIPGGMCFDGEGSEIAA